MKVMFIGIVFMICSSTYSLEIGRVNNTRLTNINGVIQDSIWLASFSNWSICLCAILSSNYSSTAIAMNMYRNGSCQLFVRLPSTFKMEVNRNSTLILLKPLPSRLSTPCNSNVSWLINRMNTAEQLTISIYHLSYLHIDDNNLLIGLSYDDKLYRLNQQTMSINTTVQFNQATSLSYHNGLYYISTCPILSPCTMQVISSKNLSIIQTFRVQTSQISDIIFVRNGSLMIIAAYGSAELKFYNVISSTNYQLATQNSLYVYYPWRLYAVNDSFIYFIVGLGQRELRTLIFSSNTWSASSNSIPVTTANAEIIQLTVDRAGRLWLALENIGIRIFDTRSYGLLYQWPLSQYTRRVNGTRLTSNDGVDQHSIWLVNFSNLSACLCAVLSSNYSSTAIAMNMYRNGSCQLFVKLPFTFKLETNVNSTLILLEQLPSKTLAPCCSDLSWLINRMNTSTQSSLDLDKPATIISDDSDLLVAHTYKGPLIKFNRTTLDIVFSSQFISNPTSVNYKNGFYYIPSCNSSCYIFILSSKNMSVITAIPLNTNMNVYRAIIFLRNNTLMLVASSTTSEILFFNVNSPTNLTLLSSLSISLQLACGLYAVNDSFVYVTSWTGAKPIYTLVDVNHTWILSPLPNTVTASGEKTFQTTIDSCGRLWLGITSYGFRIFDRWGRTLLYSWPYPKAVNGFLLKNNYELYATDYSNDKIRYFNPNISQCTS